MKSEYKTKTRNAIIDYLKNNSDTRFTARDICKALEKEGIEINRSTIYRNLERLTSEGSLVSYKENDSNATCYQYSEGHSHCHEHMHAQCTECGKIFHLDDEFVHDFENKVKKEYGMSVNLGKTVIVGVCRECAKGK
ncbi:MAG: transcriptional repressor [Lachnospiraceae bacterium]|nr:transcriptional repressor [Lachnospiraceae bacterium]